MEQLILITMETSLVLHTGKKDDHAQSTVDSELLGTSINKSHLVTELRREEW